MSIELPQATGGFGEKPQITFPTGGAPEGLQVKVLVQGDGAEVAAGDNIVVHYLGQSWDGGVFDNSYDRGATIDFPIGLGAVIGGWDQGLVGQLVGSRVLLSIPPELGYGQRGVPQAGIGAGATLVFVVDVVGVG
ncbi:peptidylprolyl isomerase [Sanguibacter gelidistatuariae]|uniref:Peptidyl-prolyl cis-trans isomerase n=1 Tax=Sanguibacter gelidistatuariae TaxID=1814289 RepID=A0A1G6QI00_9MICO|nr:FKBP-type peptidyl-prolyl cis-trans isomerase [Sanguibacter gelidistatuariae]SDC91554.1 peptidylprolyl isomerase [Sanguibacter gelidistatuariae]